jgi:hypothetical protein
LNVILLECHSAWMSFCLNVILLECHSAWMSFCINVILNVILLERHSPWMSFCLNVILLERHSAWTSFCWMLWRLQNIFRNDLINLHHSPDGSIYSGNRLGRCNDFFSTKYNGTQNIIFDECCCLMALWLIVKLPFCQLATSSENVSMMS